ncbi:MAG: NAD(P)-dependent glycerol-3-phosphate dehydrogenase [Candidatus Omnitrophica bacterium]|nr:NAD(P)-dependent glycerol-3-phosphate dehydrogenase [Candidatus Omnitrophota bacterium]
MNKVNTISIIGDGGWGTTLAVHLANNHYPVNLWGPFEDYVLKMKKSRYNSKFLPGIRLPKLVTPEPDLTSALLNCEIIVFAVPSKFTADVLKQMKKTKVDLTQKIILSVTKGFDHDSLLRISQIIERDLERNNIAVLSGPTIAIEVAKKIPTTAVIACKNLSTAKKLQAIFHSQTFRIYTNPDVAGVELGGSLKNVIALACGICDGLGYGSNTKAAILTRGLTEMSRLGKAMGAKAKTFIGLSGLGDLVTTCTSKDSRNRSVGEQIGQGKPIDKILGSMEMIAEGVETVKSAHKLAQKYGIEMPITEEIYNIIYKAKPPAEAVANLMMRKTKAE